MSDRRLLDTNVVIRHLTQDPPALGEIADRLFQASDRDELALVILSVVLAECVFVLESPYKYPRERIADALAMLLTSPGVEMDEKSIHLDALTLFRNNKLHFVDCLIASHALASGTTIASFDNGLKRLPGVKVDVGI